VAQISLLLNTNLSTHIGSGSVSWLYYANRLMEFPLGIFSIAVGTAILPALSAQHASKTPEAFAATLDWSLRVILLIGLPAALGLCLLAGPLVSTVYGHGAFSDQDVRMTTWALWAYGAGFMGFSFVKVLVPGFYARQETRTPVRFAIISLVIGMALSLALFVYAKLHAFEGAHVGLAISTSLTACINGALLFWRLKRDGIYRSQPGWGLFWLRLIAANLAMGAAVLWLAGDLASWLAAGEWARGGRMLVLIAAAMAVYFGVLAASGLRARHFRTAPRG